MAKNIVITGASKGIGKAIALYFAEKGFNLAFCGRNKEDLQKLENEILAINPSCNLLNFVCDVSQKNEVAAFTKAVLEAWSTVDILVNNAGVFIPGQVINEEEGVLEKLIETNLYSAYHVSRAFVKSMIAQQSGHIFNISSIAGLQAYPNGGSYSISKFAMTGFSKALREELKPHHVKVTAILPGATLTNAWAGVDLPESRFIKATDIAKIIFDIYSLSENTVIEDVVIRPMLGDI